MLGKILKYDMKTMSRFAIPMYIASGIISIICCAILFFSLHTINSSNPTTDQGVAGLVAAAMTSVGFYMIGIVAIAVISIVVTVMTIVRYYKSLFTDEGYLNMVLPVTTATMFNAKMLSTVIWALISSACASLCILVAAIVPIALYNPETLTGVFEIINQLLGSFASDLPELTVVTVLESINSGLYFIESIFIVLTSITLGCVIFRRAKVFASIGLYFGITLAQEVLVGMFRLITTLVFALRDSSSAISSSIFNLALTVAITVLMYYTGYYVLSRRFNIE